MMSVLVASVCLCIRSYEDACPVLSLMLLSGGWDLHHVRVKFGDVRDYPLCWKYRGIGKII